MRLYPGEVCLFGLMRYDVYIMMVRTQVSLDPEMQRRARERAAQLGVSLAEYIRRLVSRDLDAPDRTADPSVVFNLGNSGVSDVAREKDDMLGRAVAERYPKDRGR
jgi:hypothetical protein